ncbi:MAG TPA: DNA cytosine methyltransferase [Cyanophyceae cyanobacterium]
MNKNITTVSLFSGMGGVDAGFKMAGFDPIASVEFDEDNQEYSRDCERSHLINFPDAKFYLDPVQKMGGRLPKCDILQASPVCTHFSAAANMVQGKRGEQTEDLEMAQATIQSRRDASPGYFMLEQVPDYINSQSFELIAQDLESDGYRYDYKILDMADYGVPQNRKRLILLAGRDRVWEFPREQRRVGWKEAIAGIQLEPCALTRRQQLHLIDQVADYDLSQGVLIQRIGLNIAVRRHNEPCFAITRSMFVDEKKASRSKVVTVINADGIWNLPLRAIARLCGFPDWFHLGKYAGQGLGYAVPPKFVKLLCSSLILDYLDLRNDGIGDRLMP